jgi:hypothetical protein
MRMFQDDVSGGVFSVNFFENMIEVDEFLPVSKSDGSFLKSRPITHEGKDYYWPLIL